MERILKPAVTADRVGLSLPHIYRLARTGQFPNPVKIGPRASGFLESEVTAFIAERVRTRDATAGTPRANPVPGNGRGASR